MRDGDNTPTGSVYNRRTFLNRAAIAAAATTGVALSGCLGGDGSGIGDPDGVPVPGIYDLSGATADVGRPTGVGSQDAIAWYHENDELESGIYHEYQDYAYEVSEAQRLYDDHVGSESPPAIIGWGTADTEALAGDAHEDEVIYVSASYSDELMAEETGYNFYTSLDYTSQARIHLEWIAENDPDATVAFIHNTAPFGESPVEGGEEYAEELGLDLEDNIVLEPDEGDADGQVQQAEGNDVDYLIHQNTADPMVALLQAIDSRDADITVMGLTWTADELRADDNPDLYEGVRYVNSNLTFEEALDSGGRGAEIIEDSFEREDRDMDDLEDANLNYVRGIAHASLVIEGLKHVEETGGDPHSGADLREAFFELEGFDAEGLVPAGLSYEDGDRRATMAGRMYEVQDGELVYEDTIELEDPDGDWLP